jgi:heme oxygenase
MLTEELKEQTKNNHQLLEKKLVAFMRAMRTQNDYLKLLAIFYSYFGGLEHQIQNHLQITQIPDYASRRKAAALSADIEILGGKQPAIATSQFLPEISNHQQALGALYVIEGSTLGGKIISQMINKQLGLTEGLSFFKSYGEETMAMWQKFQAILDQPENLPGTEMIQTANETFFKFSEWFDLST